MNSTLGLEHRDVKRNDDAEPSFRCPIQKSRDAGVLYKTNLKRLNVPTWLKL